MHVYVHALVHVRACVFRPKCGCGIGNGNACGVRKGNMCRVRNGNACRNTFKNGMRVGMGVCAGARM